MRDLHLAESNDPVVVGEADDSLSRLISKRERQALKQLSDAYADRRPLAVLIGEGRANVAILLGRFLGSIDDDAAVARIEEPGRDARSCLGAVISTLGFSDTNLDVGDVDSILSVFLEFQKKHDRRTIVCFEQVQEHGEWVLDGIRHLLELEKKSGFGLTVILTGNPTLNDRLNEPPLDDICREFGHRIELAPFSISESREFIAQRFAARDSVDISEKFDFQAVTLIHELAHGVPDAISRLCNDSLALAAEEDSMPVTTAVVMRAAGLAQDTVDRTQRGDWEEVSAEAQDIERLVVRLYGDIVEELPISRGRILIGRDDQRCDIFLPSAVVSRYHAMLVKTDDEAMLLDLGSTNGTVVNGSRVKDQVLSAGDEIMIGDYFIEYLVD